MSESEDDARKRQKIQRQLDEALADSFPASDPVSIVTSNEEEDWGEDPSGTAPTSDDHLPREAADPLVRAEAST
jgi:hypothetical protein